MFLICFFNVFSTFFICFLYFYVCFYTILYGFHLISFGFYTNSYDFQMILYCFQLVFFAAWWSRNSGNSFYPEETGNLKIQGYPRIQKHRIVWKKRHPKSWGVRENGQKKSRIQWGKNRQIFFRKSRFRHDDFRGIIFKDALGKILIFLDIEMCNF